MPISEYLRNLRSKVGPTLLLVPSVTGLVFETVNLARWAKVVLPAPHPDRARSWIPPVSWQPPGSSG
jgi:hypothetical protein